MPRATSALERAHPPKDSTHRAIDNLDNLIPTNVELTWHDTSDAAHLFVKAVELDASSIQIDNADDQILNLSFRSLSADASDPPRLLRLPLFRPIDASRTTFSASGRGISLLLAKRAIGRWPQLVSGLVPAALKVDWSRWLDEEEELELRRDACGYDAYRMRGAMGASKVGPV